MTTATKPKFRIEDVIEHKGTRSKYRIKEFTLETAILKNLDPKARFQNRRLVFADLNNKFRLMDNKVDTNLLGQINRIEAAVKFMREDITYIKERLSILHGDAKRSLEFMHKKVDEHGRTIEDLTDLLREELGVGTSE